MTLTRSHLRRVAKWAGTGTSLLMVIAWVVTLFVAISYRASVDWSAGVDAGCICYWGPLEGQAARVADLRSAFDLEIESISGRKDLRGWWVHSIGVEPSLGGIGFRPPIVQRVRLPANVTYRFVELPLWIPLLIVATPTAFLWYRDRARIPPGHCQHCGYDLTGNISGQCSECGKPIPSATPSPEQPP